MVASPNRDTAARNSALEAVSRKWHMLIDGQWVKAGDGGHIDVYDPSTGTVIAQAPAGQSTDVSDAVRAARSAFEERRWMSLGPQERSRRLWRVAELIERDREKLQAIEILNNGIPFDTAFFFTQYAIDLFRYYAGWCDKIAGMTSNISTPAMSLLGHTQKEPVGVAGLIVPWNGPLGAAAMKLAPALAAGCTCVLKPAEETPLSALMLGGILLEAGIPAGVVNIVTGLGHEAGAAISAHPDIDKVSFTGSTEIGKIIAQAATGNLKKVSLELGGKSPVIMFDDADLDQAIPGAALGTFYNSGQVCIAGSRVYVQRSIYERVVEGMSKVGKGLRIGGGFDRDADIGPLISAKQKERVSGMIDAARADGAHVLGGATLSREGYFIEPAVIVDAPADSLVVREEIFGPVITAIPFDTPEEAIALANQSHYGLAAAVWTRDIGRSHLVGQRIAAGTVWVNCQLVLNPAVPFGGYKQSGWGRENGAEGLEGYLQTKTIITAL